MITCGSVRQPVSRITNKVLIHFNQYSGSLRNKINTIILRNEPHASGAIMSTNRSFKIMTGQICWEHSLGFISLNHVVLKIEKLKLNFNVPLLLLRIEWTKKNKKINHACSNQFKRRLRRFYHFIS